MLIARGDGCTYSSFSVLSPSQLCSRALHNSTLLILQRIERDSEFAPPLLNHCFPQHCHFKNTTEHSTKERTTDPKAPLTNATVRNMHVMHAWALSMRLVVSLVRALTLTPRLCRAAEVSGDGLFVPA